MSKRSPEEIIVLALCAMSLSALFPFAIIHLWRGEYVSFLVEAVGAIFAFTSVCYVYKSHKYQLVGFLLAVVSVSGMAINVYTLGERAIYFLYPVYLCAFLVTPARYALPLCLMVLAIISFKLLPSLSLFDYSKISISLVATILFAYVFVSQRNRQRDMLTKLSSEDALTGAGNRRGLHAKIDQLVAMYARNNEAMSLILLDLDNFKTLNDSEGHQAGDRVLRKVSRIIESRIRVTDSLFRYGGDEFVVLASRANLEVATSLAEEVRNLIVEKLPKFETPITVSIGVAQYRTGEQPESWLRRADDAMYQAKSAGKNLVIHEPLMAAVGMEGAS